MSLILIAKILLNNDVIISSKNNLNSNKLKNYNDNNLELKRLKRRKNNKNNLRTMRKSINRKNYIKRNINNENDIKIIDIYNFKNKDDEKDSTIINKIKINKCCIYIFVFYVLENEKIWKIYY